MQETCGKCDDGLVKGSEFWSVCECRKRGNYIVGFACTVCGDGHRYSDEQAAERNISIEAWNLVGCMDCNEPCEWLLIDVPGHTPHNIASTMTSNRLDPSFRFKPSARFVATSGKLPMADANPDLRYWAGLDVVNVGKEKRRSSPRKG
jgi:hypothetical protein